MRARAAECLLGLFLCFGAIHLSPAQDCGAEVCLPPSPPPAWISGPAFSSDGNYTISWEGQGTPFWPVYVLEESVNGGPWVATQVYGNQFAYSNKPNGTYAYRVSTCELQCGWPTSTHVVTVNHAPSVPSAPVVSISPTSGNTNTTGSYTVSWTQPVGWTYFLLREQNGATWGNWESINSSSRAYARPNGTYHYQARACNEAGCSTESNVAYVVVNAPPTPPTGLQIVPQLPEVSYTGDFTLTWNPAPGATDRYEIVWYDRFNQTYITKTTVSASTTTAAVRVSGVVARGENSFYVRSCNSTVCSALSASIQGYYSPMENLEAPIPMRPATAAGSMAFEVDVGEVGDARIRIPIAVPPGVNGLTPKFALTYSSGATRSDQDARRIEGYLGYGWTLSGLSQIRGCPNGAAHSQQINTCLDDELLLSLS